jgi:SagB-type dehydrogenase family enzyme
MPELVLAWRLADRTANAMAEGASLALAFSDGGRLRLDLPSPDVAAALARIATPGGLSEPELARLHDAARALTALERLRLAGRLEWLATVSDRFFACIVPLTHRFEPDEPPGQGVAVDRFAYLRRDAGAAILESSEAACRLILDPVAAAAVARLMSGEAVGGDEPARTLLGRTGFLEPVTESAARRVWSFHDRIFHAASRPAHEAVGLGPTARFKGVLPPPDPAWGDGQPALPELPATDSAPLHYLLEHRRSVRDFADLPPSRTQLEALFSRTLRITARRRAGAETWLERPVPAAGGAGEIVGYLAVRAADGMEPGIWRHDALADRLDRVAPSGPPLDRLFGMVAAFIQRPGAPPPAIVVLAAKLPQLAWKYEAIAYRLALLDAGAALGILHLVAGDVGLGACAVGTVNPRHLAALTGMDSFAEVSLAEIAVGRPI